MTLLRTFAVFLACMTAALSVHSAPLSDATLNTLLSVSGVDAKIKKKSDDLVVASDLLLEKAKGNATATQVLNAFKKPNFLQAQVEKSVKDAVSEEQAKSIIAWYQSPLGKKAAAAERIGTTDEAVAEVRKLGEKLVADPDKVKAGTKIILGTNSLFSEVQLERAISKAILAINFALNDKESEKTEEVIDSLVNEETINNAKLKAHQIQLLTMYMYRDFSVEEIEEYVEKLLSADMKPFTLAVPAGMVTAIQNESQKLFSK